MVIRSRRVLSVAVLFLLLTGLGMAAFLLFTSTRGAPAGTNSEHAFAGKSSSEWRAALRKELATPNKDAQEVAGALWRGGAEAVPVLIDLFDDEDVQVRRRAVYFVSLHFARKSGPEAAAAVGPLTLLLQDPDAAVRRSAVEALTYIGPPARDAVPALAVLLADPDEATAYGAANALGAAGEEARPALPALRAACQDPRTLVRKGAILALEKIAPEGRKRGKKDE